MYCSTCGTLLDTKLNYCNRCGSRIEKLVAVENTNSLQNLSMGVGFMGLGGLGLTVGLIAILLNFGAIPEVIVMLTIAFLATVFGISFLMVRQISQMSRAALPTKEKVIENPQLNQPHTAQLEEPRQPARSVTENTTRTLEKELVK